MSLPDPELYLSLAAGLLAGWRWPGPHRGVPSLALGVVGLLVGLLGVSLGALPLPSLLAALPDGLAFAGLLCGTTFLAAILISGRRTASSGAGAFTGSRATLLIGPALLGVLLIGILTGAHGVRLPSEAVPLALDLLVGLVAFEVRLDRRHLRGVARPVLAAFLGASVSGAAFALAAGWPLPVGWAAAFGFGWYTLTGPVLLLRFGPAIGLVAFLANFFRESISLASAPAVGAVGGAPAIAAIGGSNAMDSALYFIDRFDRVAGGSLGIGTGITLAVAAAVLVPFLSGLVPA